MCLCVGLPQAMVDLMQAELDRLRAVASTLPANLSLAKESITELWAAMRYTLAQQAVKL